MSANYVHCKSCHAPCLGHQVHNNPRYYRDEFYCTSCGAMHIREHGLRRPEWKLHGPLVKVTLTDTTAQPAPTATDNPAAWDLVQKDMQARDDFGKAKYGVRLQPGNGRDQLVDAYQEALDLCVYLRSAIYERDGK